MAVPNLDTMSQFGLHEFSLRHEGGLNYKLLFPTMASHVIPDTRTLACYAHCKWAEREFMENGDHVHAALHRNLCKDYYAALSVNSRWRRI